MNCKCIILSLAFFSATTFAKTAIITKPSDGDTMYVNQPTKIKVEYDKEFLDDVSGLFFDISFNNGQAFYRIKPVESSTYQFRTDETWVSDFSIVIPDSLYEKVGSSKKVPVYTVSDSVVLRIYEYPSNYDVGYTTQGLLKVQHYQQKKEDGDESKKNSCGNGALLSILIPLAIYGFKKDKSAKLK